MPSNIREQIDIANSDYDRKELAERLAYNGKQLRGKLPRSDMTDATRLGKH